MKQVIVSLVIGAAAIGLTVPPQADALPTLRLSDGITTITIADGAVNDASADAGVVTFIGSLGGWSINVSTGLNLSESRPWLDLNSVNVSNVGSGSTTLTIALSDTGFTGFNGYWQTAIGGTTGGTVSYTTFLDTSNTLFGGDTLLTATGLLGGPAFSTTGSSTFVPAGPYSLTQVVTITHGSGLRSSSFDAEVRGVPEPSALLLLGIGFLGIALWYRKEVRA